MNQSQIKPKEDGGNLKRKQNLTCLFWETMPKLLTVIHILEWREVEFI